jgi:hypothetical protein
MQTKTETEGGLLTGPVRQAFDEPKVTILTLFTFPQFPIEGTLPAFIVSDKRICS